MLEFRDESSMRRIYLTFIFCCSIVAAQTDTQKSADCKAGDTKCVSNYLLGPNRRLMTVTALEYREGNTEKPYLVEGNVITPKRVLYYRLECKSGGSELQVGERYKVAETHNENNIKVLMIAFSHPDKPDIIGIECQVQSARTDPKEHAK